jgi:hypothetical protein
MDVVSSAPSDLLSALAFGHLGSLGERAVGLLRRNTAIAREFLSGHPQVEVALPPSMSITSPDSRVWLWTQGDAAARPGRTEPSAEQARLKVS